ncbi:pseudouridine synthase [Lacicoccus alkaliphilus]|uniref:RNA pseudouridylate synthase n=1 Tax=Lacicoccus alkaliphilus DSM 16010 TaxID=1123231 RepID=A0A1M7E001_9BACL|nr:pseudouridine synthase [Salinicoccus alkaliphilus]SHL84928.1 23S rRNA pseudouridine1911/1915/1917 synthase [Salinicoccus alkaliphilus DSM 16010]
MDINVLYEDDHLLIIEKPAVIPSHKKGTEGEDLMKSLKEYIGGDDELYPEAEEILDTPIGGAAVFAKSGKGAGLFGDESGNRNVSRHYRAIVRGQMPSGADTLTNHLVQNERNKLYVITDEDDKDAIKSQLHYKVIDRDEDNDLTLMDIELEKGYSSLIRVQLANVGNTIHGDTDHGQHYNKIGQPVALWSYSVSVIPPEKEEAVTVESSPPDEKPWSHFY